MVHSSFFTPSGLLLRASSASLRTGGEFALGAVSLYDWMGLRNRCENRGIFLEGMVVSVYYQTDYDSLENFVLGNGGLHVWLKIEEQNYRLKSKM